MPISDWFKAREERRYTPAGSSTSADVEEGVWAKCDSCGHILYEGELEESHKVCTHCGHHFPMTAQERIAHVADEGTFEEMDRWVTSADPLKFDCGKPYPETLERARSRTGLNEAIVTGRALVGASPVVLGAMDFRFVGASMGSAVGEKVVRAFDVAGDEKRAVILFVASGGARMQEGMLSLFQMAKTSSAVARFARSGMPYISVLTNPTMGGVTASFATLADFILAEPGAMIGFTGARVIEQNLKEKLPEGFQTAEFLLEHGMIDAVVPRVELPGMLRLLLGYVSGEPPKGDGFAVGGDT
ncbi:MAG: acetyl-CoA carboxylase, carboxyltransferase subunit beta [Coriobacteriia bacterium]